MNYDEFAFFNQQLAGMLRDGVPLEGALKQLCAGMRTGSLRHELQELESELGRGTPLSEALSHRRLPLFYTHLLQVGSKSNDLPGILTLVADHYHRANALWTRLKGLMVYPLLVIGLALTLTVVLSIVLRHFVSQIFDNVVRLPMLSLLAVWLPPIILALAGLLLAGAIFVPKWRHWLRWRLSPFREASLAQLASTMALLLRQGTPLPDALALVEQLEANTPAAAPLRRWRELLARGQGKPTTWDLQDRTIPALFFWLLKSGGEDLTSGFEKAARIYQGRAGYRTEMALYGALPVSILVLGQLVFWQIWPLMRALINTMNNLGDSGHGD